MASHEHANLEAWQQLNRAIWDNALDTVSALVSANPGLVHKVTVLGSCLHEAAKAGHLRLVSFLIEKGADKDLDADVSASPLYQAARKGHLDVVWYLLEQGVTPTVDRPDKNPLFSAIYGGHLTIVESLLRAGVDPKLVYRGESGNLKNALTFAQERGEKEIIDLLAKAGCRLPVEGVDKPVWSPKPKEMVQPTPEDKAHEQLIARMAEEFGPVDPLASQEIVPVIDDAHVAINVIRPNDRCPYLTLFTTGMSDRAMTVPADQEAYQYAELVMHLPATWPHPRDKGAGDDTFWPFEWLRKVAYFPHLNETWLGGPRTIIASDDPPVPLGPNTKQTCLLLLADFANWSPVTLADGKSVRFYTVIPLYTDERDFESKHGIAPLLQRLQDRGHSTVVEVNRKCVV